jgi:hypothetical protein
MNSEQRLTMGLACLIASAKNLISSINLFSDCLVERRTGTDHQTPKGFASVQQTIKLQFCGWNRCPTTTLE